MEVTNDTPALNNGAPPECFSPDVLLSIENKASESSLNQLLAEPLSKELVDRFVRYILDKEQPQLGNHESSTTSPTSSTELAKAAISLGLVSLAAFLQANVTGPILDNAQSADDTLIAAFKGAGRSHGPTNGNKGARDASNLELGIEGFRSLCQRSLDTDGVSPYPYIPYIEFFCLARFLFITSNILPTTQSHPSAKHLAWMRFRIHLWHYKLLTQPSLGPGSLYTKGGRWTDVATLEELIEASLTEAEGSIFGDYSWAPESQVLFRLEEANCQILLGNDTKARQALQDATRISGFAYALSGALGKRTRWQENSFSQLVVLAKSLQSSPEPVEGRAANEAAPPALPLNDDTLLEKIQFNADEAPSPGSSLPAQLQDVKPDNQPELHPVDQIILLTEATLKDTFSPSDSLTLEEILPYAVRVIDDKSVNWQIYTQALLVRSRIELNRSRTVERGVLQMQAVADQVIVDTQEPFPAAITQPDSLDIPTIQVSSDDEPIANANIQKPTSFLPAPKPSDLPATLASRIGTCVCLDIYWVACFGFGNI
ncbi:hypothetical protein O1611_g10127 [Lasiodiplodia mahajangana]|uniref:Uncharacterized protein n=1 Tax=Lasiodiplodia mahajangana TaxID=1108764 RepID=A0ACC2J2D1_9PEZI|nr:hypothetical protein O1611_g10127 [Lasiodiplodia mahajangana]